MSSRIPSAVVVSIVVVLLAIASIGSSGQRGAAQSASPSPSGCAGGPGGTPVAASPSAATPGAPATTSPGDAAGLLAALEERGLRIETDEPVQEAFFNAEQVRRLVVSGGSLSGPAELQVFEYADPATRAEDASQVTPDGNLQTVMIEWIAPPHFFCGERLIVIYLGDDPAAIGLLTELFGPQFAGR